MTARANTSSGPKAELEPMAHDGSHPAAYAIVSGIGIGLLLLLIGLLSDTHDTYFSAIAPASLAGAAIFAFFVWHGERQSSFIRPHGPRLHSFESSYNHVDASNLRPKDFWTAGAQAPCPMRSLWCRPVDRSPHWPFHRDWLSAHGLSFSNPAG